MRFLKSLLLVISTIAFAVSAAVLVLSYSAISSVNPSLVMDLSETAGGANELIDTALQRLIDVDDDELREKVIAAAKAALPEETVRALTAQVISNLRKYLDSGGTQQTLLIDLHDVKAAFMDEIRKTYNGPLDEVEEAMEKIPDRANLAQFMSGQDVREISRPYKVVSNLPATSATVAVASILVICLLMGAVPGLRAAGWTLVILSAVILIGSFTGTTLVEGILVDAVSGPMFDFAMPVEPAALVGRVSAFLFGRLRIVSGIAAALGAGLVLIPSIMKRRAAPGQPTA